ncbi:MAG: 50S ribosomal protein L11 methyltransferase [Clostridiales bacterium]|nr:MAG: 50S ribosomal protein L11 methyltransferase [Clostridiales bacterium]
MKSFDTDGNFGELTLETESVCEEDWANNWKNISKSLKSAKKITICPIWEKRARNRQDCVQNQPRNEFRNGHASQHKNVYRRT